MNATAEGRILPQPTLASAQFWASGEDGILRIARCADCQAYTHPPLPACRVCGGRNMALSPVSGTATVAAVSVNWQQWLPDLPPPYTIAIVVLDEDHGVRLTTNIVGCEPGEVFIGMRVRVTFLKAEEVYLPVFEPAGLDPDPGFQVPERDVKAALRAPARTEKFEDKVVLSGVGQSDVGRRLMVDPLSLTVDASLRALEDAGLTLADIDGVSSYPGPAADGFSEGGVSPLVDALQLRPVWVNGGSETPGQIGSIMAAMLAVSAGLCRHVLCFRTVWQASHSALQRSGMWKSSPGRATGWAEWLHPFGAMSAANWIGCTASAYLHRYGVDREVLGWIALNARANAARNPEAVYRDPMTMDDYMSARMVSSPFGLYDCDVPVDGAVAVIVSAADTAADLACKPVRVEAVGTQVLERLSWDQDTLTHMPQALGPSAHLWTRTSLRPSDVDVAELYDGFTFNCLSWLEGLGFCEYGGARDFIDSGRGIALDGTLPLNTHGGQLSAGRLHGFGFVREAMLQLRGEATGRQVPGARLAAVAAGGGVPSGAMLLRGE